MTKQLSAIRAERKREGKALGLSLAACFLRDRLYSREETGPLPYLYIIPLVMGYLLLDFTLRYHYRWAGMVDGTYLPAALFTIGWTLLMTGLVFALPVGGFKFFFRCVPLMFCMACMETHSGFFNYFGHFFSLSVLRFVQGGGFASADYIHIDGPILAGAISTIVLMMLSGRMLHVLPPRCTKATVAAGLSVCAGGLAMVIATNTLYFPTMDTVLWETDQADRNALAYQEFTDPTSCVMLSGLYQYTARDVWRLVRPASTISQEDRRQVEDYIAAYEAEKTDNDYTGLFAGKNLILIQLEAMDTWMLDPDYTPNLARLKAEGISFVNHYTPAFISAGTFNTEFMANTSLLPATGGIPTSIYTHNAYPYSLPALFRRAGYTPRVFHNSEGEVYNRGVIHPHLGYESYTGGQAMEMENYQMDRYLINGYQSMTEADPFFSFVITYSCHGPYGVHNAIYQANAQEAAAKAKMDQGNYVFAVAGAMETDRFVGSLLERLEADGLLENTVIACYADHYDYYLLDDALQMKLKGVDDMDLLSHTDFFLWSQDLEKPVQVEKVTASVDILPTLTNLFGLDTDGAFLVGHDGLGDQGGYVFFLDGSWYDGDYYWDRNGAMDGDPRQRAEIARVNMLNRRVLAGNYYHGIDGP